MNYNESNPFRAQESSQKTNVVACKSHSNDFIIASIDQSCSIEFLAMHD